MICIEVQCDEEDCIAWDTVDYQHLDGDQIQLVAVEGWLVNLTTGQARCAEHREDWD